MMFAKPKSRVPAQATQTAQALHTCRALGTAPVGPLHRPAIRNGKGAHVAALVLCIPLALASCDIQPIPDEAADPGPTPDFTLGSEKHPQPLERNDSAGADGALGSRGRGADQGGVRRADRRVHDRG